MEFFVRPQRGRFDKPLAPPVLPSVYLLNNGWDDFTYRTTFNAFYFDRAGNRRELGETKILQRERLVTKLPERFQVLTPEYCSLGQSLDFYQSLVELGADTAHEILRALRDVVFDPAYEGDLRGSEGFSNSLLRFSEAEKAYNEGGQLFGRKTVAREGFKFVFTCDLAGFSRPHKVQLDFTPLHGQPHRIITFVGKNGTGKSGMLARLATTLSGWDKVPPGSFEPERPRFSRIVSLSYSIFQPFEVPCVNTADDGQDTSSELVNTTSYRYCGLRNEQGQVDVDAFHSRTLRTVEQLHSQGRSQEWLKLMSLEDIFGTHTPDITTEEGQRSLSELLKTLSSGQRIVVSIFSDLLLHIDKEALVLFDEPEVYLHPTLLSTLMRMLHALLEAHDSYAIVATHSPIVVQEIPSRSVRVFMRQGSAPTQSRLGIESFGENLTELVDHVFQMNEDDKNYKSALKELARKHSYDDILAMFDDQLSMNARMYLLSLSSKD